LTRGEVFMALMSVVLLGRRLNLAQWCSLLVISGALLLSTVAEGKGGKKGYARLRPGEGRHGFEHVGTPNESNMLGIG
jgi:drug/metabolite transporter (DMT)-like permease